MLWRRSCKMATNHTSKRMRGTNGSWIRASLARSLQRWHRSGGRSKPRMQSTRCSQTLSPLTHTSINKISRLSNLQNSLRIPSSIRLNATFWLRWLRWTCTPETLLMTLKMPRSNLLTTSCGRSNSDTITKAKKRRTASSAKCKQLSTTATSTWAAHRVWSLLHWQTAAGLQFRWHFTSNEEQIQQALLVLERLSQLKILQRLLPCSVTSSIALTKLTTSWSESSSLDSLSKVVGRVLTSSIVLMSKCSLSLLSNYLRSEMLYWSLRTSSSKVKTKKSTKKERKVPIPVTCSCSKIT